jgi:FtsZ-binding cell division protein ZapB
MNTVAFWEVLGENAKLKEENTRLREENTRLRGDTSRLRAENTRIQGRLNNSEGGQKRLLLFVFLLVFLPLGYLSHYQRIA